MRFGRIVVVGLLGLVLGCSEPKSVRIGYAQRRAGGSWKHFDKHRKNVPFIKEQINWELNDRVDATLGLTATSGGFAMEEKFARANISGHVEILELGLSYYPFEEDYFTLDAGVEGFQGKVMIDGGFGLIRGRVSDSVLGWGGYVGGTFNYPFKESKLLRKLPFGENAFFTTSLGYHFTDERTKRINVDFDGPEVFFGIGWSLP